MRKILYTLFTLFLLTSCNDGDVIEVELDFEQDLSLCEESTSSYLVYEIKEQPYESLSLLFPKNATTALIFNPTENNYTQTLTINGSTIRFNYRTYNGDPEDLFCSLIPNPNVDIINDYESPSGTVTTLTTFTDDDGDDIPSEVEDENLDGDNNPATNPTDRDGDGIPDYKDADDDNDNIPTRFENHNYSEENGLSEAQDTDGDGTPDYRDADDDGDGVLTRYEDETPDSNPRNDFDLSSETPDVPRYLDNTATEAFPGGALTTNTYTRNFIIRFTLTNLDLRVLSTDVLELGTYRYSLPREGE